MKKNEAFWTFNRSLPFDRRLYREDIEGSIAHVETLAEAKLLTKAEAKKLVAGLKKVRAEIEKGAFEFLPEDEDIHMAVERRLTEIAGPVGGKLHTGRSRNDQVATDLRLYLRRQIGEIAPRLAKLAGTFLDRAENHLDDLLPAYTHLQRGQPTTLAHHLCAYAAMLERDLDRLADLRKRVNVSPLGSGACTGTSFPIDRNKAAKRLGFDAVSLNSLDAVSDRDFVAEFQGTAAILAVHLSRLGEEWVLWSSQEFGWVDLPQEITSGSSMMPNKRNPDGAELLRGKSGRVIGNLVQILTVLKGLPFSYNKDLQEDKEGLFDTVDTVVAALDLAVEMVRRSRFRTERMGAALDEGKGWVLATEVADYLVRKNVPFRQAHGVARSIVDHAREKNRALTDFTLAELKGFSSKIGKDLLPSLSFAGAVRARALPGGPAPKAVRRTIRALRRRLSTKTL